MSELDELLARATALEEKAAEAGDDDVADLAVDLDELAADAAPALDVNEPAPDPIEGVGRNGEPLDADQNGVMDILEESGVDEGGDEWAGEADLEEGVDFDEPDDEPVLPDVEDGRRMETDEQKAAGWAPCPLCGSTERDEFTDGTARCSECGGVLSPAVSKKHFDFDDLEPDDVAEPEAEVKSGLDTMDEMDLLRARRLELEA